MKIENLINILVLINILIIRTNMSEQNQATINFQHKIELLQNEILDSTKEMNLAIKQIKNIYLGKIIAINKLIDQVREDEFKLNFSTLKLFDKLISNQFNDWWNLYLKLYENDQVYVDDNNKLYILNDVNNNTYSTLKSIAIINNFPLDIKKLTFCDIITIDFDHKKTYKYIYSDNETTSYWIYDDKIKKWSIYDDEKNVWIVIDI